MPQNPSNQKICARQISFAAAFLLPAAKLLEVPSLLAEYAKGDLLLPALMHFLTQALVLLGVLFAASRSNQTLMERLKSKLGKGIFAVYALYALYFLFAAALPLLDLEKFIYAAFFDTEPTSFSFYVFFFLSAFIATKGVKAVGRSADLCLFLFLIPFLAILGMSFMEADFTRLLPLFQTKFPAVVQAFNRSTPHFSDAVLLLPLLMNLRYEEGDGKKIMLGYGAGSFFTLLFLAVFFSIFSSIAPREHYAFSKIAQYFPALSVVGRIDLLFVYFLSVVLLFYTCLPIQYTTQAVGKLFRTQRLTLISAILNISLLVALLFLNKSYNAIYALISGKLFPAFWFIADLLPLFCLFLPTEEQEKRGLATLRSETAKRG